VNRITGFVIAAVLFVTAAGITPCRAQGYLDLTLDKAIDIAVQNNRDVKKAADEIEKSKWQIVEAASGAFPQINGFWDFQRVIEPMVFIIEFPDPTTGKVVKNRLKAGTDHSMNLGATLSQPLYVGGKVGTALKAAKIYRNLSTQNLETVKQNVVSGVVQSFNGALLAQELSRISKESLAQSERNFKNVESMHAAGAATDYDRLRARVQVSNLKPNVLDAENNVKVSLLRLKEIMGVEPESALTIVGSFAEPDTTLIARAETEMALKRRPDIQANKLNVDLYEKNIKIARGDFLPTLSAGTTFQYMGNFDVFKYDPSYWNRYWTASVNLSFPIFSGLRNSSRYKQAQVDYVKARRDYSKARDAGVIEIGEAVLTLRKAVESIESQKVNIEQAEEALRMAESLYANGKATQLEVLDAQLMLDQAKTNMVSALYNGLVAEISLKKSLGLVRAD